MLQIALFTVGVSLGLALLLGVHPNRGSWYYRIAAGAGVLAIVALLLLFLAGAGTLHLTTDVVRTLTETMIAGIFVCLASFLIDTVRTKDWGLATLDAAMLVAAALVLRLHHL